MKNLLISSIVLLLFVQGFAQNRVFVSKEKRNISALLDKPSTHKSKFNKNFNPTVTSKLFPPEEEQIGDTRYDDQANASIQQRIYLYDDGTIGAAWTRGLDDPNYSDRGSGYNYYDGNSWGPWPTIQVEEERVGWPSYAPLGENGEIIAAHGSDGLIISTRDEKGTGDWSFTTLPGPPDHEYILWNRTFTSGINNMRIHSMAVTESTAYNGTPYLGQDGALVYSLSTDGGASWQIENSVLEGMGSEYYTGFIGDTYTFAPPKDDIVAFVVGESWYDLFLMKSTDGGEIFEKTVIWEHPYPLFDQQNLIVTDTFYCADGSQSCIIDNEGTVHVVFGINRAVSDGEGAFWFPWVDGIAYWNENMPTFSNNLNALSPYGDPGSEIIEDYNLIAWTQDINDDGNLEFADEIGTYYVGFSSYPQLVYGQNNELFLIYSSVTETYNNSSGLNYRHLWARMSPDGGLTWDKFLDLSSDLVHVFDECVYPACAPNSDDYIHLVYQTDTEPGVSIWGTEHPAVDNNIMYMKFLKSDLVGVDENEGWINENDVSQNYPNPVKKYSTVNVNLNKAAKLKLELINITGQKVFETPLRNGQAGMNTLTINAENLAPGVYFYTVIADETKVTKKMIVE